MKFLCPNCKAKYQIADEKVSGRTLRMDCRRCGHNITIRADMAIDDADEVAPKPAPTKPQPTAAAGAASRRAGLTGAHAAQGHGASGTAHGSGTGHPTGGALGADFHRSVSKSHTIGAPAEAQRTTPLDQWHVAINDVPVGPLRREEIVKKIGSGAVTADSLCWREGLDDWRPLRDVPELAALLRRSISPEAPARPPTGRTPLAGPPRAPAPAPAAHGGRPPTGAIRTAARSNVVPIGGRLGGAAAPALEDDGLENNEPTRVGTVDLADLEAKALAAEQAEGKELFPDVARPPTGKTNLKGPGGLAPPPKPMGRPETGKTALPSVSAKPAPKPAPKVEPKLEPVADEHDLPFAEPSFADVPDEPKPLTRPAAAVATPAPAFAAAPTPTLAPALAPVAPAPAAPAPAAPVPAQVASVPPREERRGLPIPALIAIAGATAFGGVLAFMIGTRFLGPTAPPAPAAVATVQPTSIPATAPPPTADLAPPPTAPPATTEAATPEVPPTAEPPTTAGSTHTPRLHTPTTPTSSGTAGATGGGASAATKAPTGRFAEFADDSSGGPAQIATTGRRSIADDPEEGSGGASTRGQQELTADQIRSVITRERPAVNRCWESELRRIGQATTTRLDVDLTIGGSGTVTSVTTRGQSVGTLADCIERNVRRWRFPPTSGTTQTSFPLVFSGTE